MAPRRARISKFNYKKLTANDVICPICRSILIKPVTLPCSHDFCASCFELTTQNANLVCPLCRIRICSWFRTATKSKKIINETYWQAIQDLFPLQVRNKLKEKEKFVIEGKCQGLSNAKNFKRSSRIVFKQSDNAGVDNKSESRLGVEPISIPSSSKTDIVVSTSHLLKPVNSQTTEKRSNLFVNNFATKEYTCRILCQNVNTNESQAYKATNRLAIMQKKNKQLQKIANSETNSRSNSIESECLYFKPIDYRRNPPSECSSPIKVPSRKPSITGDVKIIAPCGQNKIHINFLESAFARLIASDDQKIQASGMDSKIDGTSKRKHEKSELQLRKKTKNSQNPLGPICKSKETSSVTELITKLNNTTKRNNIKEHTKRFLQEQADFELAKKLQQSFNQSVKYSTRSSVLKRINVKNQEILTPVN